VEAATTPRSSRQGSLLLSCSGWGSTVLYRPYRQDTYEGSFRGTRAFGDGDRRRRVWGGRSTICSRGNAREAPAASAENGCGAASARARKLTIPIDDETVIRRRGSPWSGVRRALFLAAHTTCRSIYPDLQRIEAVTTYPSRLRVNRRRQTTLSSRAYLGRAVPADPVAGLAVATSANTVPSRT